MKLEYKTKGVCSRLIRVNVEDGIVKEVAFVGGCNGNASGISALVKGRSVAEVVPLLRGTRCDGKPTSCPDQLAIALTQALD